jgi:hypothetical protein
MITDAKDKLTYLKTGRELADLDAKIRELEIDVGGPPRYTYNLRYATDFGRESSSVQPEFAHKKFDSTEDIIHFIEMLIVMNDIVYIRDYYNMQFASTEQFLDFMEMLTLTDDIMYIRDTYNIPSSSNIEKMFNPNSRIQFNISLKDDDYPVPPFEITRTRIKY